VKIATDLYFSRAASDAAREKLVEYLKTHSEITRRFFRDLLGASRKFRNRAARSLRPYRRDHASGATPAGCGTPSS